MEIVAPLTLVVSALAYTAASATFYMDVVPMAARREVDAPGRRHLVSPQVLLAIAAVGHTVYVGLASFVAHVCPIHSVHFLLSVASLFATATYLTLRRSFRIDALGVLVAPLGLAFLLGTYFLGEAAPEPRLSPVFIALHVLANLLGVALFLLAGGAASLYLVQEKRLKEKRRTARVGNLPALDTLDAAEHRFLVAGFPLLTLGIVTGTFWAQKLETGSTEEVMRTIFGYATWLLIGGVLLLRAAAGWRGRRSAYGTILGLAFASAVLAIYLFRPAASLGNPEGGFPKPLRVSSLGNPEGGFPKPLRVSSLGNPEGGFPKPLRVSSLGNPEGGFPKPLQASSLGNPEGGFPKPLQASSSGNPEGGFPKPLQASSLGNPEGGFPKPLRASSLGNPEGGFPKPLRVSSLVRL